MSRATKVAFCLGAVCVLLSYLVSAAESEINFDELKIPKLHAVNHHRKECKGGVDPTKANNCEDSEDDDDNNVNDDVDDAYKVLGNVKVPVKLPASVDDDNDDDDDDNEDDTKFDVLGH